MNSIKIEENAKDGGFLSDRNLESTVQPTLFLTSLTCPSPGPELEALTDKFPTNSFEQQTRRRYPV